MQGLRQAYGYFSLRRFSWLFRFIMGGFSSIYLNIRLFVRG
jgi:hypothetical protein